MNNLNIVTDLINSVKNTNKFIIKAKKEKIKFYKDRANDIEKMDIEKIKSHDFKVEILNAAITIEKLNYFSRYKYKLIDKLEKHEYSPEQNKIYFRNMKSYIKIPNITSIEKAISFIINNQSLDQIKSI